VGRLKLFGSQTQGRKIPALGPRALWSFRMRAAIGCLALLTFGIPAFAGTFTAFGPQTYTRTTGAPVSVSNTFSIPNPSTQYTLRVDNGGLTDSDVDRVSSTGITLNGVQIIGTSNFNQNVAFVEVPVTLQLSNQITVQVRGAPGGTLVVRIFGVDNNPPVITAAAEPMPNPAGWNNSDVTVTFACSDALSGVALCPSAMTVTTEGANQSISGTTTDNAGNVATASVTLKIDKTPPTITAASTPAANSAGWNNSDVNVAFTCNDALSGVTSCPSARVVSVDGANQIISGTATDVAGNSASATAIVNLDKTPPVLTISTPSDGATVTTAAVTLVGTAGDSLSGIATVICNGLAATSHAGAFSCGLTLTPGANSIAVVATDIAGNITSQSLSLTFSSGPVISGFSPLSVSVGNLVTISGSGFAAGGGTPQVTLASQDGGTIAAPAASSNDASITIVIPSGAASGSLTVTAGGHSTTSATPLSVVPPSSFTLAAAPASLNVIQGQSSIYSVTLNSSNGFNQLAALSVTGFPAGVNAIFNPPQITAGQTAILTVSAPAAQPTGISSLVIAASSTVNGIALTQIANVSLNVQAIATSFIGRTTIDDGPQTPLAGVKITFLGVNGMGEATGCNGQSTTSDEAGNFSFAGLPDVCAGEQLVAYDGSSATTAKDRTTPGVVNVKYAGVDLLYEIVAHQVSTPSNLIRLPRIDDKETVMVAQNAAEDQTFVFKTIPGLVVTVYAGTVFSLADHSQPNPFPLIAIKVPVDRLPDEMPLDNSKATAFIVAFQPANAVASQPVAVTFPNTLNTAPGVNVELDTLNPTIGMMVRYGSGTVSDDGTSIVPDFDPAHPNHRFGLVHFDWHGPLAPVPPGNNPSLSGGGSGSGSSCTCPPGTASDAPLAGSDTVGDPIDLASGLQLVQATDIAIIGGRGTISVQRVFRSGSNQAGPFGIGSSHQYAYQLSLIGVLRGLGQVILILPDGNQVSFSQQPNGSFTNSTVPAFRGAVIHASPFGTGTLKWKDGTIYQFESASVGPTIAYLTGITDANGNTISLDLNSNVPGQLIRITDPVGRSLTLNYDGFNRVLSVADPIGRTVQYAYNDQGTLASVTDFAGGVTRYRYDLQNNLTSITDPRGVVVAQDIYDANGRVIQQVRGDGGVITVKYDLLNGGSSPSLPVVHAQVTDPQENVIHHRFSPTGLLTDVIDAAGQARNIGRDPQHSDAVTSVTGAGDCEVCPSTSGGDQGIVLDENGNVLSQTDALGNTTSFTYEPDFNKVSSIKDALGNITRFAYDANGNLASKTDANGHTASFSYNAFGQVITVTDALKQVTRFAYDNFGNLVGITGPLGNATAVQYDAVSRPVATIDALGRKTATTYDALDRVVSRTDAKGGKTSFAYDAVGNLLSVTDALGHAISFTYDSLNRLLTRTDPLGKSDSRTYDKNGNLVQFVDRRGQVSKFSYDSLNRLVIETYQDSTVTRSYDSNGRLAEVNDTAGGQFGFSYDAAGRLLKSTSPVGSVEYAYDAAGRTVSRQVVGQPSLQYTYDAVGNMLSAALPQASASFQYDPRNRVSTITRGNGVSSQYQYDPAGRLLSLIHSGPSGVLNAQAYSYDAGGNRISYLTDITQPLTTAAATAQYDAGNRLISRSDSSGPTTFTFDENGNETSKTDFTGTTVYTWDARNRLKLISGPNGQVTRLAYDFLRNLIIQADSGPLKSLKQSFVLDRITNVAYGSSDIGSLAILSGNIIDQHIAISHSDGHIEYSLTDAMGSTVATADQSGNRSNIFSYEPFGSLPSGQSDFPFTFTGRVQVSQELYYYRSRFYDSLASRFVSEDPLGSFTAPNLYVYSLNRPNGLQDPLGLYVTNEEASRLLIDLADKMDDPHTQADIQKALISLVGLAVCPECEGLAGALEMAGVRVGGSLTQQLTTPCLKNLLDETLQIAGEFLAGGLAEGFGDVSDALGLMGNLRQLVSDFGHPKSTGTVDVYLTLTRNSRRTH
jgi:RHS repeat-associated protein